MAINKILNKANGHIVQVDWDERDETSFSFIHNKPDLSNLGLTEEEVIELINIQLAAYKALPVVTLTDAGKFLRVSENGEWVAETIQSTKEVAF